MGRLVDSNRAGAGAGTLGRRSAVPGRPSRRRRGGAGSVARRPAAPRAEPRALLPGLDVRGDVERDSRLAPFESFNCFSVLLELLEAAPPSLMARAGPGAATRQRLVAATRAVSPAGRRRTRRRRRGGFRARLGPDDGSRDGGGAVRVAPGAPWRNRGPASRRRRAGRRIFRRAGVSVFPTRSQLDESDGSRWGRGSPAALHHRAWLLRAAAATLDASAPPPGSARVSSLDDLPPVCAALARAALRRADDREEGSHPLAALELLATLPPVPPPPLRAALATMTTTTTVSFGGDPNPSRPDANDPNASHHVSDDVLRELGVAELLADRRPVADGGCSR